MAREFYFWPRVVIIGLTVGVACAVLVLIVLSVVA
jgi:hypothetical protein